MCPLTFLLASMNQEFSQFNVKLIIPFISRSVHEILICCLDKAFFSYPFHVERVLCLLLTLLHMQGRVAVLTESSPRWSSCPAPGQLASAGLAAAISIVPPGFGFLPSVGTPYPARALSIPHLKVPVT